jgi:pteridine reductase
VSDTWGAVNSLFSKAFSTGLVSDTKPVQKALLFNRMSLAQVSDTYMGKMFWKPGVNFARDGPMPSPTGKILITGATGTIGGACALALAREETQIVLHCRAQVERAQALQSELEKSGSGGHIIQADFLDSGASRRLVAHAAEKMGGLNILVHCAALFEKTPFSTVTPEQWDRSISLNLKTAFFLAQAAASAMEKDGGRMIFLSDVAATKPYGSYFPYCIAKAGVDSLVRGLARSLAPKIQVNAIAPYIVTRPPGISDTGWNDLLNKTPMRRASTPQEIAALVSMLATSAETITGQVMAVDGGRLLR